MKQWTSRIGGIGGILALSLSCGGPEEPRDVSTADVKEEAREAIETAEDYAAVQRREFVERAQQTFDDAERELVEARSELAEAPAASREQLERAIERAERAWEALGKQIDGMQQAGEARWETAQRRVSNALDEMAEARREVTAALTDNEKTTGPS